MTIVRSDALLTKRGVSHPTNMVQALKDREQKLQELLKEMQGNLDHARRGTERLRKLCQMQSVSKSELALEVIKSQEKLTTITHHLQTIFSEGGAIVIRDDEIKGFVIDSPEKAELVLSLMNDMHRVISDNVALVTKYFPDKGGLEEGEGMKQKDVHLHLVE